VTIGRPKKEPMKKPCKTCEKIIIQQKYAGGKWDNHFKKRKYCSPKCSGIGRSKAAILREDAQGKKKEENQRHCPCDVICPLCGEMVLGSYRVLHKCCKASLQGLDRKLSAMETAEHAPHRRDYVPSMVGY
jgi:hypothetical protein